jgi:hypothetical protein
MYKRCSAKMTLALETRQLIGAANHLAPMQCCQHKENL